MMKRVHESLHCRNEQKRLKNDGAKAKREAARPLQEDSTSVLILMDKSKDAFLPSRNS
jgi:hypothetical protein